MKQMLDGELYEYEGTVTQLGVGSEVANIGLKFEPKPYSRIVPISARLFVSTQAAAISARLRHHLSTGTAISLIMAGTLNGQATHWAPGREDGGGGGPNNIGNGIIPVVGNGQYLQAEVVGTLDALTTFKVSMIYLSADGKATVSAVGAGISISGEVHKSL